MTPEAAAIVLATPIPVNVELSPFRPLFVSTQLLAFAAFRAIRMDRMTLRRAGCLKQAFTPTTGVVSVMAIYHQLTASSCLGLAKPVNGCDYRRVGRVARNPNLPVTSSIIIRTAAMAEQKALEALQLRASLTNDGDREALLANPDAIKIPLEQLAAGRVFVSELSGVTVGFSAIEARVDGETELDALFVEPDIRRHGIGRLMVEYCAEVARKQGSTALHVTGNPHAEDFYLACGFKQIGTIQTRFGVGLMLRKEL